MREKNNRKHLTEDEVEILLRTARKGRYPSRDECLIQLCFIHGFRVSEISNLKLSDVNIEAGLIHVRRLKNGLSTTHPLIDHERHLLKLWLKKRNNWVNASLPWLFLSQKGGALSRQRIYSLLRKYGELAGIPVSLYPHMLRHSCGFALANTGADTRLIQDYLGHRNIQHTVIYTASNSARFFGLWKKR